MKNKGFLSIILACSVVLLLEMFFPRQMDYLILDHSRPLLIPLTMITYMFMHAGFKHYFYNLFLVAPFAMFYERKVGAKKFLRDWLLCGLGSSLFFMAMPSFLGWDGLLGASGACSGMFALALLNHQEDRTHRVVALLALIGLFMSNLIPGIIDYLIPSRVAHMGHVGGILSGVLIYSSGVKPNEAPKPS